MTIDSGYWHAGGDNFPKDVDEDNSATHIGFFIAWAISKNLLNEEDFPNAEKEIKKVQDRKMSGRDFLFDQCDNKLLEQMLNTEGQKFSKLAYHKYLEELEKFARNNNYKTIYHLKNTWETYDTIRPILDKIYSNCLKSPTTYTKAKSKKKKNNSKQLVHRAIVIGPIFTVILGNLLLATAESTSISILPIFTAILFIITILLLTIGWPYLLIKMIPKPKKTIILSAVSTIMIVVIYTIDYNAIQSTTQENIVLTLIFVTIICEIIVMKKLLDSKI